MKQNIKVILSTLGPLNLIKCAEKINRIVDVQVIQGWIPSWWNKWLLYIASYIQKRNIFKTIKKRTPNSLKGRNKGIALPDMYFWACRLFKLLPNKKASINAAMLYGWMQKKYLKDADIYHVRSGSGANGAIEKARENGMKVVVDHSIAHPAYMDKYLRKEYERNGECFDMGMDSPFWKEIVDECDKGDVVIVNSHFVKDTFCECGFDKNKLRVVVKGVREDFFELKKNYEIKDKVKILFTGGFGFRKGAEYVLRALCKLDLLDFNYEMTVIGDYYGAEKLINRYSPKHLNLINTIPQDDLIYYLANSDIYLFPSLSEGCAASGMEALAAGLPVIATRESGLPINNGEEGLIIQSRNVDGIVNAILELCSDKSLREKLGRNAAKKIAECYTWDKYSENIVAVYKELLRE